MAAAAEPRLLLLETSSRVGQVGLAQGGVLLAVRRLAEARRHARDLAPAVQDLLAAQGWAATELSAVVVSKGPGSYTGLRVGIMSAKALAYATGCALLGVETFAAIASQAPPDARSVDVLADAQQDRVYVERFGRTAEAASLQSMGPLQIRPYVEWSGQADRPAAVTGPGMRGREDRVPPGVRLLPPSCWDATPQSVLELGLARYRRREWDDLWSLEPLYLRPSSAEEQWARR